MEGKYVYFAVVIGSLLYNWYKKSKAKENANRTNENSHKELDDRSGSGWMNLLQNLEQNVEELMIPKEEQKKEPKTASRVSVTGAENNHQFNARPALKELFEENAQESKGDVNYPKSRSLSELDLQQKEADEMEVPHIDLKQLVIADAILNRPKH